jgi:hypothetical protein
MRLIIAAALALASVPAIGQECTTLDQMLESVETNGDKVVGSATYDGIQTEQMIIVQTPELILMMGFDAKGCYYGMMAVEQAQKPDTGA